MARTPEGRRTGSGQGRPAEPALGIRREYFHPAEASPGEIAKKIRREVTADQRQAAALFRAFEEASQKAGASHEEVQDLAGRGVCFCAWTQIAGIETEVMRVPRTKKRGEELHRHWHSYMTGLQMCGLRWVCPVCTAKRAEEDRRAVNDGLSAARDRGLYPVMLTFTTRHHRDEAPADVFAGIKKAEQRIKRLKPWERLSQRSAGYVRVLEWTYQDASGHHPHFHSVMLIRAESEEEAIAQARTLQPSYMRQLAKAGRDGTSKAAWKHSFQVQGASAVGDYITKWGVAEELTGAQRKDGGGLTPWQLLRLSRTASGDKGKADKAERARYASIWWEIIQATKHKAQLYKSEGWNQLVEEWRAEQLEPEPEPEPEPQLVAKLGHRNKGERDGSTRFLLARRRSLAVREAAESVDDLAAASAAVEAALISGPQDDDLLKAEELDLDNGPVIEVEPEDCEPVQRSSRAVLARERPELPEPVDGG